MEQIPFLYRMIRGAVGKRLVVKHYQGGRVVMTRFPDMSGVVASSKQRVRRDLFREAVVFARWVIGDEGRKLAFRSTLPRKKRRKVYQVALQLYLQHRGSRQWVRMVEELVNGQWSKVSGELRREKRSMIKIQFSILSGWRGGGNGYEQRGPCRVVWEKKACWDVVAGEDVCVVERDVGGGWMK